MVFSCNVVSLITRTKYLECFHQGLGVNAVNGSSRQPQHTVMQWDGRCSSQMRRQMRTISFVLAQTFLRWSECVCLWGWVGWGWRVNNLCVSGDKSQRGSRGCLWSNEIVSNVQWMKESAIHSCLWLETGRRQKSDNFYWRLQPVTGHMIAVDHQVLSFHNQVNVSVQTAH